MLTPTYLAALAILAPALAAGFATLANRHPALAALGLAVTALASMGVL